MTLSVQSRAARLVAELKRNGVQVASLTIKGEEIKVTFGDGEETKIDAFDLVDYRR